MIAEPLNLFTSSSQRDLMGSYTSPTFDHGPEGAAERLREYISHPLATSWRSIFGAFNIPFI